MRRPQAHTHFEISPPDDPNHDESRDWAEWADWFALWPMDGRGKRVVPLRYSAPDGRMLGWWLQKQRLARKMGLLRKQYVGKLTQLVCPVNDAVCWPAAHVWQETCAASP